MANWIKKIIPRKFRTNSVTIPVVRLQGVISSASSALKSNLSLASCANQLERAFNMQQAPAVAIVINSPGGSPVQSRLIYKRIRDLAQEKNKSVLVFVEDVAASGGYMIACAGDEIFADPSSVVGSIGVVSSSFGFSELMKKIGVERRVYTAGQNKSSLDPFSPEKKSDIEHLKSLQLEIHDVFINLVKDSRKDKLSDNKDIFTGMFWTGIKGKELGLVDELDDMRTVLQNRYGKNVEMRLVNAPKGLLGRKSSAGIYADIAGHAVGNIVDVAQERVLWSRYGL